MKEITPVTLELNGVRLEPLSQAHADGLRACAMDGELWKLRITSVPEPENVERYIAIGLEMRDRLPFAVIDSAVRDTVIYSIVHGEWPEVRAQLDYRLNR